MPWVRFTEDFTFVPLSKPMVSIAYKRGMVAFVNTECAERAILKQKAERTTRPETKADDRGG